MRVTDSSRMNGKRPQDIDDATRRAACDELIRLRIRGASQKQCAKTLGFHLNTIKKWMKKPEWKLRYMKTRAEIFGRTQDETDQKARHAIENVEQLIEQYAAEAAKKIFAMMMDPEVTQNLQLKAAIDLADRGRQTSKTKKVQTSALHAVISPEDLALMAQTAREIELIGKPVEALELDTSMVEEIPEISPTNI